MNTQMVTTGLGFGSTGLLLWSYLSSGGITIRLTRLQPRARTFLGAQICVARHTTNKITLEAFVVDRVNQDGHDHELA